MARIVTWWPRDLSLARHGIVADANVCSFEKDMKKQKIRNSNAFDNERSKHDSEIGVTALVFASPETKPNLDFQASLDNFLAGEYAEMPSQIPSIEMRI